MVVQSFSGPKNDGIIWGDYEVIEKADVRVPEEALAYYLSADKTWYQTEFHDHVPVGPGSYPYRDRTATFSTSRSYRIYVWFWSRSYRMKAAIDSLWRQAEVKLDSVFAMLDEAGWDGRGPAKTLLGSHGSFAGSPGYKGYWLASFAMACNMVWRYAKFADQPDILSVVEPLCHETTRRILDLRVPSSGIYKEIDTDGNLVERMHPDIAGWVFDGYDWDESGQSYVSRAWIPPLATGAEEIAELFGITMPFQLDWTNQANASYESTLMYWKALDMYVGNFG